LAEKAAREAKMAELERQAALGGVKVNPSKVVYEWQSILHYDNDL